MSYNENLTRDTYQEVPATVDVLANDLSLVCGGSRDDIIDWFRDSWMYARDGIFVVNAWCLSKERGIYADRERTNIVRLLYEIIDSKHGSSDTIHELQVFSMGRVALEAAEKLRSAVDRTRTKVTLRVVDHPAAIARRHSDLRSPECTLGSKSFSKALYKAIEMSKQAAEARKQQEKAALMGDLRKGEESTTELGESMAKFVQMMEGESDTVPKALVVQVMKSVTSACTDIAMSFRNVSFFVNMSNSVPREASAGRYYAPSDAGSVRSGSFVDATQEPSLAPKKQSMSAAELRKSMRSKHTASSPAPVPPVTPAASVVGASASSTTNRRVSTVVGNDDAGTSVASMSPSSLRKSRAGKRPVKAPADNGGASGSATHITAEEAKHIGAMSEFMMSNRTDDAGGRVAEELDSAKSSLRANTTSSLKALDIVRTAMLKNPGYSAANDLGLVGDNVNVMGWTYQFCLYHPADNV